MYYDIFFKGSTKIGNITTQLNIYITIGDLQKSFRFSSGGLLFTVSIVKHILASINFL